MTPENKRFYILIGMIGIAAVILSMTARFLGPLLWRLGPPEAETAAAIPAGEPVSPSVAQPAREMPPAPPVHRTAKGAIPPEFHALEARLTAMERDLANHAGRRQALRERMAEADELIRRAEGGAQ